MVGLKLGHQPKLVVLDAGQGDDVLDILFDPAPFFIGYVWFFMDVPFADRICDRVQFRSAIGGFRSLIVQIASRGPWALQDTGHRRRR